MSYDAPFAGLKVVDLSQGIAGPYSAMLLAQYGADVIKVEPPEGDWARALGKRYGDMTAFAIAANLGKRSIVLDLKTDEGRETLRRLVATADVFLESFRPGVAARLGFGYPDVSALNPRIIYLSVSGFGQDRPGRGAPRGGYRVPGLHRPHVGEPRARRHPASRAGDRDGHGHRAQQLPGNGGGALRPPRRAARPLHRIEPAARRGDAAGGFHDPAPPGGREAPAGPHPVGHLQGERRLDQPDDPARRGVPRALRCARDSRRQGRSALRHQRLALRQRGGAERGARPRVRRAHHRGPLRAVAGGPARCTSG